jgi:hypothetical protein
MKIRVLQSSAVVSFGSCCGTWGGEIRRYHGKKDDDGANNSISALGWVGFERAQQSFGPGYPPCTRVEMMQSMPTVYVKRDRLTHYCSVLGM